MRMQETFSSKAHYECMNGIMIYTQVSTSSPSASRQFLYPPSAIVLSHLQVTHCHIIPDIALTRLYEGEQGILERRRSSKRHKC